MSHQSAPPPAATTVRYGSRDGSGPAKPADRPPCPGCGGLLPSARARSCSAACKQRIYRRRHAGPAPAGPTDRAKQPGRRGADPARTVYECPACDQRFLAERRCPDCNRFCRALGPGGPCPHCDEPVLLADLLPEGGATLSNQPR